jgi:4-carboxymuconolactone decarboxylase
MSTAGKPPRFPQLTMEGLNDQQRPLAEQIMKISSVGIGGPYNVLLRSPVLAQRMYDLAILIQGRLWRSQVEWYAHFPLAVKAGLSERVALDLKANKRPAGMQPDEAAVYDYCMELSTEHAVADDTFNRLRQFFSEQQVVDLTVISGTYVTIAMILSASETSVPPGKELPFKPGEP